jgi:hypothetical protein
MTNIVGITPTGRILKSEEELDEYANSRKAHVRKKDFDKSYTICDIQRKIYQLVDKGDKNDADEIKKLLEIAYVIAKKMDARLKMYKMEQDEEWYESAKKSHKEWIDELNGNG